MLMVGIGDDYLCWRNPAYFAGSCRHSLIHGWSPNSDNTADGTAKADPW